MNGGWARIAARMPGLVVGILTVVTVRSVDGFPWALPSWVVVLGAIAVGLVLDHIITHAVHTYFGFDDDEDDDDDNGPEDDDPYGPIIVPDSPKELLEPVR